MQCALMPPTRPQSRTSEGTDTLRPPSKEGAIETYGVSEGQALGLKPAMGRLSGSNGRLSEGWGIAKDPNDVPVCFRVPDTTAYSRGSGPTPRDRILGGRKEEHEEKEEGVLRSERRNGKFSRLIPLPEGANVEQVAARFNNGVLEVTIPIAEEKTRNRQIPIEESKPTGNAV